MATKFLLVNSEGKGFTFGNSIIALPDPSINAVPNKWEYSSGYSTKSFNISTTPLNGWKYAAKPSWVSFDTTKYGSYGSYSTLDTSCDINTSGSSRSGSIVLSEKLIPSYSYVIDVSQAAHIASMSVSPNPYEFDSAGENNYFGVTSNVPWDVSTAPAWVTINNKSGQSGNGYFYGLVAENSGSYRSGNIVLKCTTTPDIKPSGVVIPVSQDVYVPPRSLYVEYNSSQLYYMYWDSAIGWCCDPAYHTYTVYMNVVCTSGQSWYCNFEPDNGEFYKSISSGTGNYSNWYIFNNSQDYSGRLAFYWTDDDTLAWEIYLTAYNSGC